MKKALSILLAVLLVSSLCLMNVSAAENVVGGQTVISREFLKNLFENPWQDEDGAVVEYKNVEVALNGSNSQALLYAGVHEVDEYGEVTEDVLEENQTEGYIIYKLNVTETTRELSVGMVYHNANKKAPIKVYVSDTETFGDTAAAEFEGTTYDAWSYYRTKMVNVAVNEDGDNVVYVKVVLPYGNVRTTTDNGGTEIRAITTGINRLMLNPVVTDALHTTDTSGNNNGDAIIDTNLLESSKTDSYHPWSYGMYEFSPFDKEAGLAYPSFKMDEDGHPMIADQTFEGQFGGNPITAWVTYKVNTVSAMESAKIIAEISLANSGDPNIEDNAEFISIDVSKDNENWVTAEKAISNGGGGRYNGPMEAELDSAWLDGTDTLYVRVSLFCPCWPNWAMLKGITIETSGANPAAAAPENPPAGGDEGGDNNDDNQGTVGGDQNQQQPGGDNNDENQGGTSNDENLDNGEDDKAPATGVSVSVAAILTLAGSAATVALTKKRK